MTDGDLRKLPEPDLILKLASELQDANSAYISAKDRTQIARGEETTALNRLNDAQKRLDAAMAEIRSVAPYDSHWKQSEKRGIAVE